MHDAAMAWVVDCVDRFGLADRDVLDLGGFNVNGSPRHLFTGRYVVVDIKGGGGVDIVADAATLDLEERFPVVLSTELFEHTPEGEAICQTAARHLDDDGIFVATMAGPGREPHSSTGGYPVPANEWYRNVDPYELDDWLWAAGFTERHLDQLDTDLRCWARREVE